MSGSAAGLLERGPWAWRIAFRALGRLGRPVPVVRSQPGGGVRSVLVLAPHPDDETLGVGGTLLRHREAGDRVTLVHVTDGRRSRAGGLEPERMAARRREEAAQAAQRLGVGDWAWLGLREGEWRVEELVERMATLLRVRCPDVLYVPSRVDFHPEHLEVAHAAALALADGGPVAEVRAYPVQVPLGPLANLAICVASVADRLLDAMLAHASQSANVGRAWRMRSYAAAARGVDGWVEELWRLEPERYVALHRDPPRRWTVGGRGVAAYRGVRAGALGDPLAYLRGRGERHRLRRASEGAGV